MPQITVYVVFDTNSIWVRSSAERLLAKDASELVRSLSRSASPKVHWCLSPMVKAEREYQMIVAARELLSKANKALRFMRQPELTEGQATEQVRRLIETEIQEHGIEEIDFDESRVDWTDLINRAVRREPPFEKGESEKGFRDAIILETFLQFQKGLNLSPPNKLVLLSHDGLLKVAAGQKAGPEVLLIDSIADLETYLVALSEQIDKGEAEQIVLAARRFLVEEVTVKQLGQLLAKRFENELRTGPPEGGVINALRIVPGETALVAKQKARWRFQTTILVEVETSRTIPSIPSIREAEKPFVTSPSEGVQVPLYSSTLSSSEAGAPRIISVSTPLVGGSSMDFVYSLGPRVVKSIGRHTTALVWSATLSNDKKLSDFKEEDTKYEGVAWE
jgi:hypothetical protein